MRKRDELKEPDSCLNKARDDEWLFVLLGRDCAFPGTVRKWIEERVRLGLNQRTDAKLAEAEAAAAAVEEELNRSVSGLTEMVNFRDPGRDGEADDD